MRSNDVMEPNRLYMEIAGSLRDTMVRLQEANPKDKNRIARLRETKIKLIESLNQIKPYAF